MDAQKKVITQNGTESELQNGLRAQYSTGTSNASVFKSILKLKEDKKDLETKLREVESSLEKSTRYKKDLMLLNEDLKAWAARIQAANRNNQGVPYVRDIKDICNKILSEMRKDEFKKIYGDTLAAEVPCFKQIYDGINNLEKLCSKVLQNEANYKATWVEEMRQLIGRLIGSSNAILDLYYEG